MTKDYKKKLPQEKKEDFTKTSWERLPGETAKAYAAFACYRDMGPIRSIQKVGKRLVKKAVPLGRLSKKYNWVERAKAYDLHMERIRMDAREIVEIERERKRVEHVELYEDVGKLTLQYLRKSLKSGYTNTDDKKMIVELLSKYPPAYKEMVDIGRSTQILEREKVESLMNQENARDMQHDREILIPLDKTNEETIDEQTPEKQNILSFTGSAKNRKNKKAKELPPKKRKLNRGGPQGRGEKS